ATLMRVEVLEAELRRRAVEGWLEPVYYRGKKVGDVRKFSDTCLIFALKGEKPEKYRERFEHAGKDGGPVMSLILERLASARQRMTTEPASKAPVVGSSTGAKAPVNAPTL